VAVCGSIRSFDRCSSLAAAEDRRSLAPQLAPPHARVFDGSRQRTGSVFDPTVTLRAMSLSCLAARMALAYDAAHVARDVGAFKPCGVVHDEAVRVAENLGLPRCAPRAGSYVSGKEGPSKRRVFGHPGLRVTAAPPRHISAMRHSPQEPVTSTIPASSPNSSDWSQPTQHCRQNPPLYSRTIRQRTFGPVGCPPSIPCPEPAILDKRSNASSRDGQELAVRPRVDPCSASCYSELHESAAERSPKRFHERPSSHARAPPAPCATYLGAAVRGRGIEDG